MAEHGRMWPVAARAYTSRKSLIFANLSNRTKMVATLVPAFLITSLAADYACCGKLKALCSL